MVRSIFGVIAGVVGWGVVFNSIWFGLAAVRPDTFNADKSTSDPMNLAILLLISFGVSIFAGWLAKVVSKSSKAVMVLAAINLLIGIGVQVGSWDAFPIWFHVPFLAGVVPFTIIGERLIK